MRACVCVDMHDYMYVCKYVCFFFGSGILPDKLFVCDILYPTNDHVVDAGILLTISSNTVLHDKEPGTIVEKKPLLVSG